MIDAFMDWAGTFWGMTVLAGVVWFAVSCVFCLVLGSIIARFGAFPDDVPVAEQTERRSPRRAGDTAPARREQEKESSTG